VIVNLDQFIARERPQWERLEAKLKLLADDPWRAMTLAEIRELERLYQRGAADLARLATFAAAPEVRFYLEKLVSRGHAEIHGTRADAGRRFRPRSWLLRTLPQTWRRQAGAFWLSLALMLGGAVFGSCAVGLDPEAKSALMPFTNLRDTPTERVAREQRDRGKMLSERKARFSGMLMTHNTRVTLMAVAMGITAGVGTLVLMFYNGVVLGAVVVDYVLAGQTPFLLGWLLPHGVIEIPAMLVGGQAGFVIASALLGRGRREDLATRLRLAMPDVVTLSFGAALMLVWAGIIEAFFSQYHEPVLPYAVKIGFGFVELVGLVWFLGFSGHGKVEGKTR
jgi:uncharacterized membrane protein SpoIIM required for sporulation